MSELFKIKEVVDFAVKIEQAGYKFYIEAIKKIDNQKCIEFFQIMADEEFQHENTFKQLAKGLEDFKAVESYPGEYKKYLNAFLKSHSLADPVRLTKIIESITDIQSALNIALEFEKDSIVLFSAVKSMVGENHGKTVEKIIQEEIVHILRIKGIADDLGIDLL
jgi:rubrerythrin